MRRFVLHLAGTFILAASVVVSADDARGSFDRTLDVSGRVRLEIWTGSGDVTVRRGGDDTVEIHGEIHARSSRTSAVRHYESSPPVEQDANIITVGRILDRDLRREVRIDYEIVVPSATEVVSKTGSGNQKIDDIAGPLEASSGSGSLDIGRIGAGVDASSGSGSIEIDGVTGDLSVETGSGDIRAEAVTGAISVRSGSGTIDLEQTGSGDVDVHSSSGRVRVEGVRGGLRASTSSGSIDVQGAMTAAWELHTSSGSVTVELPDAQGFDLDAETHSGRIDLDDPVTTSGRISNKRLHGTVRGGGPRLDVSTSSGSIRIK